MEIAILMARIGKSHANNAMLAKMVRQTSKPVAAIGSYCYISQLDTHERKFYKGLVVLKIFIYYILF